jgi:hypothetical protein
MVADTPVRVRSPWYVGQSGYAGVGAAVVADDEDEGAVVGPEVRDGGGDDPPVQAPRTKAATIRQGTRIVVSTVDGPDPAR